MQCLNSHKCKCTMWLWFQFSMLMQSYLDAGTEDISEMIVWMVTCLLRMVIPAKIERRGIVVESPCRLRTQPLTARPGRALCVSCASHSIAALHSTALQTETTVTRKASPMWSAHVKRSVAARFRRRCGSLCAARDVGNEGDITDSCSGVLLP